MKRFANKSLLLSTAIILALFSLPVAVLAGTGIGTNVLTQTINGYQVSLVFEKTPPVGENRNQIAVKDAMGMPVSQADLEVSVIEAQAEHVDVPTPSSEAGTMFGMSVVDVAKPTPKAGTMSDMNGMDVAQPTPEAGIMSGMSGMDVPESAGHDQMGMVALVAGHESGQYEGLIAIESDGELTMRVHLTVAGKLMEVDVPIHVAKLNTGVIVLGSFLAVNVALIAAAVVMKPKPVSLLLSKKA